MIDLIALAYAPSSWAALAALIAMELVLGIDNLVFIAILSNRLPYPQSAQARRIGIGLSIVFRVMLVGAAGYLVKLTNPLFALLGHEFSWRDLILIGGGSFLVWKATLEIHHNVAAASAEAVDPKREPARFPAIVAQIVLLDVVFSIDSIITAVGMTEHVPIMIIAVVAAVLAMLLAADPLANFIRKNQTIVMLALGFLLLIGTTLIAEGFGIHFPKGYIYAAMGFSGAVEALNMLARRGRKGAVATPAATPPAPPAPPPPPKPKPKTEPKRSARNRGQRRRRR